MMRKMMMMMKRMAKMMMIKFQEGVHDDEVVDCQSKLSLSLLYGFPNPDDREI